jgi:hypothetical protein
MNQNCRKDFTFEYPPPRKHIKSYYVQLRDLKYETRGNVRHISAFNVTSKLKKGLGNLTLFPR